MECDCSFWWPFFRGMGLGVALILTPSFVMLALLLRSSSTDDRPRGDDDGPTRGT